MEYALEFPIVVIGAGAAGMMAALRSAELGRDVLLLEKSVGRGSNTDLSGGFIQAAGTRFQEALGIEDSPEMMMDDIMRKNGGKAAPEVVRAICQCSREVIHFLADKVGLELHLDTQIEQYGHSAFRMHATRSIAGSELVAALRSAIAEEARITFVDETHVTGLLQTGSRVVGVELSQPSAERVGADSVLLCCDGFGANREMVRRYCPEIEAAIYIGSENNTGDGIRWGVAVGATCEHMSAYQGHCHVNPKHGTRLGGFLPNFGSVILNLEGKRFEREDLGYSELARVVLAQPGGVAIEIFDQRVFDLVWQETSFREAWESGAIRKAETLVELAALFDVPQDALDREVKDYNRGAVAGVDRFGRQAFGQPLERPFYGALVTGALVHTQGGLRIAESARVLRQDGSVIEGLYAAGGTAAGMSGDGPDGYLSGNGIIHALATGYIAAQCR